MRRTIKSRGTGRAWWLALALTCFASVPLAATPRLDDAAVLRAFGESADVQDLRRRLVPLGSESLPLLFRIAVAGRLPASGDEIPAPLAPEQRQVVREVLTIVPRKVLNAFLEDLAAVEQTAPTRLEALRLLTAVGSAEHLRVLARITVAPRDRGLAPALRSGFEAALAAILERDPQAHPRLRALVREVPATLAGSVVRAIAADPAPEASGALADLLGLSQELDLVLLTRIGDRGRRDWTIEAAVRDQVRRHLAQREANVLCAAARAAGRLGDDEAVPALIELLNHAEERVRAAGYAALRSLSGLGLDPEPEVWQRWYSDEMDWWDTVADSVLARVEREHGVDFVRAASELMEHRLYRERAAESLVQALGRHDSGEVRFVCQLLGNLGSPVAIAALEDCLRHDDPAVRRTAAASLERLAAARATSESDSGTGRAAPSGRPGAAPR